MNVIEAIHVTKTFRIGVGRARVREMIAPPADRMLARALPGWWSRNTFDALSDVSLMVERGTSLGLVGHNGAGKTTLLKVLAGITAPVKGTVAIHGRVAALIDVLIGFHPELTGRENMFLLGALHGYSRKEMNERMGHILEFAEIDDLADTPLKRFSAGMTSRLGFATVTALDPDVLLVDEVLSVGDSSFQGKCARWLDEYRARGGTLLIVSHNLSLVRNMTERVVWLDHGKVMEDGLTPEVLGSYARAMERRDDRAGIAHSRRMAKKTMESRGLNRWGAGGARVAEVHFGEPSRADLEVAIAYESDGLEQGLICIGFVDEGGKEIGGAASPLLSLNGGSTEVRCTISPLPLRTGIYFPVVAILSGDGVVCDRWRLDRAVVVDRAGDVSFEDVFGPVEMTADWSVRG
jgi:ABC-type polysaccharide/polyol phosphate transport system ATPase subunit